MASCAPTNSNINTETDENTDDRYTIKSHALPNLSNYYLWSIFIAFCYIFIHSIKIIFLRVNNSQHFFKHLESHFVLLNSSQPNCHREIVFITFLKPPSEIRLGKWVTREPKIQVHFSLPSPLFSLTYFSLCHLFSPFFTPFSSFPFLLPLFHTTAFLLDPPSPPPPPPPPPPPTLPPSPPSLQLLTSRYSTPPAPHQYSKKTNTQTKPHFCLNVIHEEYMFGEYCSLSFQLPY